MDGLSASIVNAAVNAEHASVAQQASLMVLKKAMDLQAVSAATLIQALPQPALATSGTVGTLVNAYA